MPSVRCNCNSRERRREYLDGIRRFGSCDWELIVGYYIAISLAVFEAKRLLVIVLELLIQWNVIRIAGGVQPVILSFIDIFLGFFSAFGIAYILGRPGTQFWSSTTKRRLKVLLILISICIMMNIFTLVSVSHNVSVSEQTIASAFNNSMNHYIVDESDKFNIDTIQFDLQCCGHSNYLDWFCLNWRTTGNASEYDGIAEINDCSVPFSCCRILNPGVCIHTQMTKENIDTINNQGCSGILSDIIIKIVFVAYVMGIILIVTQIFLGICIVRMLTKSLGEFSCCTCDTSRSLLLFNEYRKVENYCRPMNRRRPFKCERLKKIRVNPTRPRHCHSKTRRHSHHHSELSLELPSNFRISPSIHSEHRARQNK